MPCISLNPPPISPLALSILAKRFKAYAGREPRLAPAVPARQRCVSLLHRCLLPRRSWPVLRLLQGAPPRHVGARGYHPHRHDGDGLPRLRPAVRTNVSMGCCAPCGRLSGGDPPLLPLSPVTFYLKLQQGRCHHPLSSYPLLEHPWGLKLNDPSSNPPSEGGQQGGSSGG